MNIQVEHRGVSNSAPVTAPLASFVMLLLVLVVPTAKAVEVLSAKELGSHCALLEKEPKGVDATYCIRYIQGFIDGAVATDVNVMLKAETASTGSSESFSERAMRTRAPSRAEQYRAAQFAGFCLGDPLPLRDVVEAVVADLQDLSDSPGEDASAMEFVYVSLQQHYPCTS